MISKVVNYCSSLPSRIRKIDAIVNDNKLGCSYYPDEKLKSRLQIVNDLLWWLIRYQEVGHFYRVYGLDRISESISNYITCGEFQRLRDMAQRRRSALLGVSSYRCILGDKFLFGKYLESLNIPSPRIIAVGCNDNISICRDGESVKLEALLQEEFDGFVKPLHGMCGKGIFPLAACGHKAFSAGKEISLIQLRKILPKAFMVQARFKQHALMDSLFPHSVNTLRIVTFLKDDSAQIFGGFLRAGVGTLCCDNWATGGILGGIDMQTGRAAKVWKHKPGQGTCVLNHPDTGFILGDLVFPWFHESCRLICEIHQKFFYGFHSVGWDIAAGPDGPTVIEGNESWSIEGFQAPYGGLRQSLESLFVK